LQKQTNKQQRNLKTEIILKESKFKHAFTDIFMKMYRCTFFTYREEIASSKRIKCDIQTVGQCSVYNHTEHVDMKV